MPGPRGWDRAGGAAKPGPAPSPGNWENLPPAPGVTKTSPALIVAMRGSHPDFTAKKTEEGKKGFSVLGCDIHMPLVQSHLKHTGTASLGFSLSKHPKENTSCPEHGGLVPIKSYNPRMGEAGSAHSGPSSAGSFQNTRWCPDGSGISV